jgi:regulator of RNase E activity RraA
LLNKEAKKYRGKTMNDDLSQYIDLLSTDISDAMADGYAMDIGVQALYQPMPRIMGPAYTVRCCHRSNTYLHDAIYKAPKGAVIVVEADDINYAVAGGNVCAVAAENGIAGFVIDGVIRDIGEIQSLGFPVFARGVFPKPGGKTTDGESQITISCGNVTVAPNDLIVADREGIVVIPCNEVQQVLDIALKKQQQAEQESLGAWREKHHKKIVDILN